MLIVVVVIIILNTAIAMNFTESNLIDFDANLLHEDLIGQKDEIIEKAKKQG